MLWLGYHTVLKRTELPRLRHLGFEVFCPPYLSAVYDQSADAPDDACQQTTLPADVFAKLHAYDFFHSEGEYPPEIAELINAYFGVVIVTINAQWLNRLLRAFTGRVIYRLYGQHFILADQLVEREMWSLLTTRPDFSIVPFAPESMEYEHRWLQRLCSPFVPYQMPDDAVAMSGTWASARHDGTIATSIPNIENPYFGAAYDEFSARHPQPFFRIYGPQRATPNDPRIVGQLDRVPFLERLRRSAGFYYGFHDHVCYLPPIEFMQIGGPVIFVPGSLLARFYGAHDTPGRASSAAEVEKKLTWLLRRDRTFIDEVIAAQDKVRLRYDPATVNPVFDKVFLELLEGPPADRRLFDRTSIEIRSIAAARSDGPSVVFLLHLPGLFARTGGRVHAVGSTAQVARSMIDATLHRTRFNVIVTCASSDCDLMGDLFEDPMRSGRLVLHVVDRGRRVSERTAEIGRLALVSALNRRSDVHCVVVPHPFGFPEGLLLRSPILFYSPGFAIGTAENELVGIALAKRARRVFSPSAWEKRRISALCSDDRGGAANKIAILPSMVNLAEPELDINIEQNRIVADRLAQRPYLFYPTANRQSTHLAFLVGVFAKLRESVPRLALVLTCNLDEVREAADAVSNHGVSRDTIVLNRVGDGTMAWLYQHAAALCLTSSLDGRFPAQIFEALHYGTPIVATRLEAIVEMLGEHSAGLALCDPLDQAAFVRALSEAIMRPTDVVRRQQPARQFLAKSNLAELFCSTFCDALLAV